MRIDQQEWQWNPAVEQSRLEHFSMLARYWKEALARIPGLAQLGDAYNSILLQNQNITLTLGTAPRPKPASYTAEQIASLEQQFPEAHVFAKAHAHSTGSGFEAGLRAMQCLIDGGSAEQAQAILDGNMTPA